MLLGPLDGALDGRLHGIYDEVTNLAAVELGDMVEDTGVNLGRHLDILEGVRIMAEGLENIIKISHRPGDSEIERTILPHLGGRVDDTHHLVVIAVLVEEDLVICVRTAAVLALNVDRGLEHLTYWKTAMFKSNEPGHPTDRLHRDHALEEVRRDRHSRHDHSHARPRRGLRLRRALAQHPPRSLRLPLPHG